MLVVKGSRTCSLIHTVKVSLKKKRERELPIRLSCGETEDEIKPSDGSFGWEWERDAPRRSPGGWRNASVLDRFIAVIIIQTGITSPHLAGRE